MDENEETRRNFVSWITNQIKNFIVIVLCVVQQIFAQNILCLCLAEETTQHKATQNFGRKKFVFVLLAKIGKPQ